MSDTKQPLKIIGSTEHISFPDMNGMEVTAKIDTGAYTGALHCTKISVVETADGKVLRFSPFDHPELVVNVADFTEGPVKSSNGKEEQRYFIDTNICVKGETYPIVLTLADRSEMRWPVLIGRRFLRQNNFLVDVNQRATYRVDKKQ